MAYTQVLLNPFSQICTEKEARITNWSKKSKYISTQEHLFPSRAHKNPTCSTGPKASADPFLLGLSYRWQNRPSQTLQPLLISCSPRVMSTGTLPRVRTTALQEPKLEQGEGLLTWKLSTASPENAVQVKQKSPMRRRPWGPWSWPQHVFFFISCRFQPVKISGVWRHLCLSALLTKTYVHARKKEENYNDILIVKSSTWAVNTKHQLDTSTNVHTAKTSWFSTKAACLEEGSKGG